MLSCLVQVRPATSLAAEQLQLGGAPGLHSSFAARMVPASAAAAAAAAGDVPPMSALSTARWLIVQLTTGAQHPAAEETCLDSHFASRPGDVVSPSPHARRRPKIGRLRPSLPSRRQAGAASAAGESGLAVICATIACSLQGMQMRLQGMQM